ncbi:hypothetical protein EH183_35870 [Streptomyces sp. CB01881]|nr:hypothetical protein EH183_35870 [Streptomyces sp. CB01881]
MAQRHQFVRERLPDRTRTDDCESHCSSASPVARPVARAATTIDQQTPAGGRNTSNGRWSSGPPRLVAPTPPPNHGRHEPNQQTPRPGRRPAHRPRPAGPAATARADVTTVSVTTERTAWDRNEPGLGPDEVAKSDFGVRFSTALDGQVFAQPLVIGPTVVVVTETNHVYGINANTGKITWHRENGPAWPSAAIGCSDPGPNVGTTSTPVYDPATGTVYLTSKVTTALTTSTRTTVCTPSTPRAAPSAAAGRSPSRATRSTPPESRSTPTARSSAPGCCSSTATSTSASARSAASATTSAPWPASTPRPASSPSGPRWPVPTPSGPPSGWPAADSSPTAPAGSSSPPPTARAPAPRPPRAPATSRPADSANR